MNRSVRPAILAALVLSGALMISGCAREISSGSYEGPAAGEVQRTFMGVVENVRTVEIQESDTLDDNKTGQVLGGVAGGFAGSAFGAGLGRAAAIAAGAIVGTFAGAAVEQEAKRQPATEYIVRSETGELVTIVQGPEPRIAVGTRVYVQEGQRGRGRVIPAA